MVSLADPTNNYIGVAPAPPGCLNGKAIMCYACYTYQPVFLWIVGVTTVGLNAFSGGGLPQVDSVMVFDFSGSMDDATNVSFIRRTWDSTITTPSPGSASYAIEDNEMLVAGTFGVLGGSGYPGTQQQPIHNGAVHYIEITPPTTSHRFSDSVQFNYTASANGMAANVLPPENLDQCANVFAQASPAFLWDMNLRTNTNPFKPGVPKNGAMPGQTAGNNWQTDYGTPPGNCTLDPPYGYGRFWAPTFGIPTMNLSGMAGPGGPSAMAYRTDERLPGGGGPDNIFMKNPDLYVAYDYTAVGQHRDFTDLIVNIADPGTWPYTQPLIGPSGTFVGPFTVNFPAQEPDANIAGNSYTFEDIGVVVEAARGNLDLANYARGALLDRGCYWTIPENGVIKQASMVGIGHVAVGYQEAYQRLAMLFSQPIATALDGADGGFFQKINSLCDCRFGFCGFSNSTLLTVGASPNSTTVGTSQGNAPPDDSFYISPNYSIVPQFQVYWDGGKTASANNNIAIAGGVGNGFRTPRRPLKKAETQANSVNGVDGCRINTAFPSGVTAGFSAPWNQTTVDANGLENGQPIDETDTYEAVNTARYMFLDGANYDITNTSKSRPAAKHAIVFFSDGIPNGGTGGADASGAIGVANACKGDGIAIYSIGMDVTNNPILQAGQIAFMGNSASGLAGASGNGGRFFQCQSASTVKQAFNAVARRLAQSQR
jgi:hypothetical protein